MPRQIKRLVPLVTSTALSVVLLPVAVNVATGGSLAPLKGWVWPLVGVLWLGMIALTVRELRTAHATRHPEHIRNRVHALDRVDLLIAQRLTNSLAEQTRIALALDARPDAVIRHARLRVLPVDNSDPAQLPEDPAAAFRLLDESMLVLGAPGAGKTTLLLELTRALVTAARNDDSLPVPVLLDLAGWSRPTFGPRGAQRPNLVEWLLDEVERQYGIPAAVTNRWLSDGKLGLLFDGLDEVPSANRAACVTELNALQDQFVVPQLAVTSREHDYSMLDERLHLHGAVVIRPLAHEQVTAFLDANELVANDELTALLTSPLMLNVVALALQDRGQVGAGNDQHALFDAYVVEMLSRTRRSPQGYRMTRVLRWLRYLALTAPGAIRPTTFLGPYSRNIMVKAPPDIAAAISRLFMPAAFAGMAAAGAFRTASLFGAQTGYLLTAGVSVQILLLSGTRHFMIWRVPQPVRHRTVWVMVGGCLGVALGFLLVQIGVLIAGVLAALPPWLMAPALIASTGALVAGWWRHEVTLDLTEISLADIHPRNPAALLTIALGSTTAIAVAGTLGAAGMAALTWAVDEPTTLVHGCGVGLGLGTAYAGVGFLAFYIRAAAEEFPGTALPTDSWTLAPRWFPALFMVLASGLAVGAAELTGAHHDELSWPALAGITVGLLIHPVMVLGPPAFVVNYRPSALLTRLLLVLHDHVPLRRGRFLRYATERILLVHADTEYRFVHALVRDHLARQDPAALADRVRDRIASRTQSSDDA